MGRWFMLLLMGTLGVWRGSFLEAAQVPEGKVLNNFVLELLNVSPLPSAHSLQYDFANPRDGWVFFTSTAQVGKDARLAMALDEEPRQEIIVHTPGTPETREAMRFLGAGKHRLRIFGEGRASLQRLIVRSVPEILYCKLGYNPWVSRFGPYDWEFLQKHILPQVNTIVGTGSKKHAPFAAEWKARGGKWMVECSVPGVSGRKPSLPLEEVYNVWARNPGFQDPLLDGVIADEFLDRGKPHYPVWTAAIQRLAAEFPNKAFYPYFGGSQWLHTTEHGRTFVNAMIKLGFKLAWERYLPEQPTEAEAEAYIRRALKEATKAWAQTVPDLQRHLIVCLGVFSSFPLTLNHDPNVDFKVYLDMQFHHLATDPAFRNLYGIMDWTSGYMDEETVRWLGKLYRHYCLEGKRTHLSEEYGFRYRTEHLRNPDFAVGLTGWSVTPAEEGSMEARQLEGYGWTQGRWPRTKKGDTFLWMKRSAHRPNRIAQDITNLEPGRLYALKFVTADFQGLTQQKTEKALHALSIQIEGAEPVPERSFQEVIATRTVRGQWLNYHWRVFRARSSQARLVISDWASATEPGGPIGQELMLNFVELQPYLE